MTNSPEYIEIEEYTKQGKEVPQGAAHFKIRVDKEKFTLDVDRLTGKEILALVNKTPDKYKLFEHVRGQQPSEVQPNEIEIFSKNKLERFSTLPRDTTEGRCG